MSTLFIHGLGISAMTGNTIDSFYSVDAFLKNSAGFRMTCSTEGDAKNY